MRLSDQLKIYEEAVSERLHKIHMSALVAQANMQKALVAMSEEERTKYIKNALEDIESIQNKWSVMEETK